MAKAVKVVAKKAAKKSVTTKQVCGIIMPISAIDGCTESHWSEVMEIISESIEDAGFIPNIVSNADEVGIIQKRIIQNLYDNPIVVCDVSGKNPNVMFELGVRLAFDKPTIIIKDDKTAYSFDTSPIEHLEYPRDLRFSAIVEFKEKLKDKIIKTYQTASENPEYTTFLKHFGEFKVAKLDKKEVSEREFILDEIKSLRSLIESSNKRSTSSFINNRHIEGRNIDLCCKEEGTESVKKLYTEIHKIPYIKDLLIRKVGDHSHILVTPMDEADKNRIRSEIRKIVEGKYKVRIR